MNKLSIIFISAFSLSTLLSCDEVEKFTDVKFSSTISQSLPVAVTGTDEMTISIVLDATTDTEIKKYADKIKKYEIEEILFAIENYDAPTDDEIYFNGEIGFSNKSVQSASSSCTISPLNVTHVNGTGDFNISTCDAIVGEISTIISDDNAIKIYMTGTFTNAPLSFRLKVTIKVAVTANPL